MHESTPECSKNMIHAQRALEALSTRSSDLESSIEDLDDSWCTCGRCDQMENDGVCCHSIATIIGGKFGSEICITLTSGFHEVCLSRNVLEAALGTWRHLTDQPVEIDNRNYIFIAFRQFVSWVYGWLGKDAMKVIPSCVGNKITCSFPIANNDYCTHRKHLD